MDAAFEFRPRVSWLHVEAGTSDKPGSATPNVESQANETGQERITEPRVILALSFRQRQVSVAAERSAGFEKHLKPLA